MAQTISTSLLSPLLQQFLKVGKIGCLSGIGVLSGGIAIAQTPQTDSPSVEIAPPIEAPRPAAPSIVIEPFQLLRLRRLLRHLFIKRLLLPLRAIRLLRRLSSLSVQRAVKPSSKVATSQIRVRHRLPLLVALVAWRVYRLLSGSMRSRLC